MSILRSLLQWAVHTARRVTGFYQLKNRSNDIEREVTGIGRRLEEFISLEELHYRDLMLQLGGKSTLFPPPDFMRIETDRPMATDSSDHICPRGTRNDNTRRPRFVYACERCFPNEKLSFLDLGCAGGGLVLDFLLRGHEAAGVEGSDYSLRDQRAEWRLLGNSRLFTADIAHPFHLFAPDGGPYKAHVVSAWEFMEHIAEDDLPAVFANVASHLSEEGYFIGSVALYEDRDERNGMIYHRTVRPREWWEGMFAKCRFSMTSEHGFNFSDFCRGVGNGSSDLNFSHDPSKGFHFVARME